MHDTTAAIARRWVVTGGYGKHQMSEYALQRLNMVESQVRPSDLTDRRISRAMLALPREAFVPPALRPVCYMDQDLRLTDGGDGKPARFMLAPRVQAKMVQALEISDDAIVLDVGCGMGYSTALLARLAATVVAVEEDDALASAASEILGNTEVDTVAVVTGPLVEGHEAEGPYDAILLNGAVDRVPPALLDQLKDGGRLVAIDNSGALGRATCWRRIGGQFGARALFDAQVPPLPGFQVEDSFVF